MNLSFTGERYVPELRGQIYYEHFHRYAMVLELARGADVLDIASGEGYGTAALALVAKSALGVDNDPTSIQHAAARYTAMNVDFRLGECTQIPAGDAAFDLVVSFETIEHLAEHERMLKEVQRVLRPGGRLVISSPNKLVYTDARSVQNPYHVRELYFHEFRDLLRTFFPVVKIFGQRIFAASAVHPLRGAADETRWLGPSTTAEPAMTALPDPEYFIAICGMDDTSSVPDLCSVYLDPRDELLADVRSGGLAASLAPAAADSNPVLVAELEERQAEISDDFSRQTRQLEAHAGGLETLLEAERGRSARLVSRVEELAASAEHAGGLETLLDAERGRSAMLAARVEELSASVEHLADLETLLEAERQRSGELVTRLQEAAASEEAARSEAISARAQSERLQRSLAGLRLECESIRDANAELERRHEAELRALEAELDGVRARPDQELVLARQNVARLQMMVDSLTRTVTERSSEYEALREAAAQATQSANEAENAYREAERTIAQLRLEQLNLQDATAAAETRLADVLSSRSWRLTLPARRLMGTLRARRTAE